MYFVLYRNCSWGVAYGPVAGIEDKSEAEATAKNYAIADGRDWDIYEAETRDEAKHLAQA